MWTSAIRPNIFFINFAINSFFFLTIHSTQYRYHKQQPKWPQFITPATHLNTLFYFAGPSSTGCTIPSWCFRVKSTKSTTPKTPTGEWMYLNHNSNRTRTTAIEWNRVYVHIYTSGNIFFTIYIHLNNVVATLDTVRRNSIDVPLIKCT